MLKLVYYLVSFILLFSGAITRPQRAQCPPGWWLAEGVRRDGSFACYHVPIGDTVRDARGIVSDPSTQPPGEIRGRIYCTGGAQPIIDRNDVVGCQRGGW